MTTTYVNHGQVGAMGDKAHASNFEQKWVSPGPAIDLPELARQLERLQREMGGVASSSSEFESTAAIAKAKEAAGSNDGPSVFKHLAEAGSWALGVAEKVGTDVATAAIKASLGLP